MMKFQISESQECSPFTVDEMEDKRSEDKDRTITVSDCTAHTAQIKPLETTAPSPITAVLDNITNNSNRGVGSTSITISNCHDDDRFVNGKATAPIPNKVTEYVKGICF